MKFVKSEIFIVTVMAGVMLILSMLPTVIKRERTPAGRDFIPVHNSLSDYPYYTSIIKQGISGSLTVVNRYTIEPHNGGYVHVLYLVIGWIGRITGLHDAHVLYTLSRFILGGVWMGVMYWFVSLFAQSPRAKILAFFFAIYSASYPYIDRSGATPTIGWHLWWWSETDPIQRATFLPHFLIGHMLLAVCMISFWLHYKRNQFRWIIIAAVSGWFTGMIHPPSLIILLPVVPLWVLISRRWQTIVGSILALGVSATSFLILKHIISVFPWNMAEANERVFWSLSLKGFLLALGPVVPLAAVGLLIRRNKISVWLLAIWVGVTFFFLDRSWTFSTSRFALVRLAAITNIRFLQTAVWLPLGVLAAESFVFIKQRFGNIIYGLILGIFLVLTFAGYPSSVKKQTETIYGGELFTYPTAGWIEAIKSLETLTKPGEAVLSLPLAGQIIPTFADRTVYVGNIPVFTQNLSAKMDRAWGFYHGSISVCDAYHLLKDNGITAIFNGYDEQNEGNAVRTYSFVQPWKKFGTTEVFTFVDVPPVGCR